MDTILALYCSGNKWYQVPIKKVPTINYPVRIHDIDTCKCQRIVSKIKNITVSGARISKVIERITYSATEIKIMFVVITTKKYKSDNCLENFFKDTVQSRDTICEYFQNEKLSFKTSTEIRKIINKIPTACYCFSDLSKDRLYSNAGIFLLCNYKQARTLSHIFNKYVQKAEFNQAQFGYVENLDKLQNTTYNLSALTKHGQFKKINQLSGLCTVIGVNTEGKYDLAFGKREWSTGKSEDSVCCAKRELYEELNIQFSNKIWNYSQNLDLPKYAHRTGWTVYFVYLPHDTAIKYHPESETIYLNI